MTINFDGGKNFLEVGHEYKVPRMYLKAVNKIGNMFGDSDEDSHSGSEK